NNFGVTNRIESSGQAAIGAAIGTGVVGYLLGPRYARNASYNVTSGDASVAFAGAAIGALALTTFPSDDVGTSTMAGLATAGLVGGFLAADRFMVRMGDRTAANGTLTQLGALAGALMG